VHATQRNDTHMPCRVSRYVHDHAPRSVMESIAKHHVIKIKKHFLLGEKKTIFHSCIKTMQSVPLYIGVWNSPEAAISSVSFPAHLGQKGLRRMRC
jgi:hypothetical protein